MRRKGEKTVLSSQEMFKTQQAAHYWRQHYGKEVE